MNIYLALLYVALLVVYVVDLSGFTGSWRRALKRALGLHTLRRLPPFDCGQCATWWASQTVLDIASRVKGRRVSSLKPLTCSLCMTWWVTLTVALCLKQLTLPVAAFCAALSFASATIADVIIFINEGLKKILNLLYQLFGL